MLEAIVLFLELVAIGEETVETITEILTLLGVVPDREFEDLDDAEKLAVLKECTKIVVRLNLFLSAFPLGYETTLIFDRDGNPIP